MRWRPRACLAAAAALLCSCGSAHSPVRAGDADSERITCEGTAPSRPDLFGWDPGSRAKLATLAVDGVVVVRFQKHGCDLELSILPRCTSKKSYYVYDREPLQQSKTASNHRELWTYFPIAAGRLGASLNQGQALRVDATQAGIERLPSGVRIEREDLIGDCDGATHVVSAIHRGAFALISGQHQALEGDVLAVGIRARSNVRVMDRAGELSACDPGREDLSPGCDIPLRVELTSIGESTGELPEPGECPSNMVAIPGGQFRMG